MDKKYFIILVVGLYGASLFSASEADVEGFLLDDLAMHDATIGFLPRTQSLISSEFERSIDSMTEDNSPDSFFEDDGDRGSVTINAIGAISLPREPNYAQLRREAQELARARKKEILIDALREKRKSIATAIENLRPKIYNENGFLKPGAALLLVEMFKLQNQDLVLLKEILSLTEPVSKPLPPLRFAPDATTAAGLVEQIEALERDNQIDQAALVGQDRLRDDAKRSFKQWIAQRKAKIKQLQAKFTALQ